MNTYLINGQFPFELEDDNRIKEFTTLVHSRASARDIARDTRKAGGTAQIFVMRSKYYPTFNNGEWIEFWERTY